MDLPGRVRAFARQQPLFVADVPRAYPPFAELALRFGARALLAAPITAGEQRLGVLAVYAPRAPMFAEDDLALVELLRGRCIRGQGGRLRTGEALVQPSDEPRSSIKQPHGLFARAELHLDGRDRSTFDERRNGWHLGQQGGAVQQRGLGLSEGFCQSA